MHNFIKIKRKKQASSSPSNSSCSSYSSSYLRPLVPNNSSDDDSLDCFCSSNYSDENFHINETLNYEASVSLLQGGHAINSYGSFINEVTTKSRKAIFTDAFCEEFVKEIERTEKIILGNITIDHEKSSRIITSVQNLLYLITAGVAAYHLKSHFSHDKKEKEISDIEAILTIIPLAVIPFVSVILSLFKLSGCFKSYSKSELEKFKDILYVTNDLRINDFQNVVEEAADEIFSQYERNMNNIEDSKISGGLEIALRSLAQIAVHRIISYIGKDSERFKNSITDPQTIMHAFVEAIINNTTKISCMRRAWTWIFGKEKKPINKLVISNKEIPIEEFYDLKFDTVSGSSRQTFLSVELG